MAEIRGRKAFKSSRNGQVLIEYLDTFYATDSDGYRKAHGVPQNHFLDGMFVSSREISSSRRLEARFRPRGDCGLQASR
jgi:hypothetical protein